MTEAPPHQLETGQPAVHAAAPVRRRSTRNFGDPTYRFLLTAVALVLPFLLFAIGAQLLVGGWPALSRFGIKFVTSTTWDPVAEVYGAAPMIFGTVVSSLLALLIAVPLALGTAIFLTEFAPKWLRQPIGFLVELLAAVPSVVYGLWGIFVLIPMLRGIALPPLRATLGWTPFFKGVFYGPSMLAGGVILAIMIVPYIAAVSREVLLAVPATQREAALGLGATRWEAVWSAVLPYGRAGIIGAIMLGFGRALGETMAVTMVIGNNPKVALSLFAPQYTMAAVVANEFAEAADKLYLSALVEIGLVLFIITLIINSFSRLLIWSMARTETVAAEPIDAEAAA
jgi:phosphate transport system permease protein